MPTWPASLPTRPLAESYKPRPPQLFVRTQTATGPAYHRKFATAGATALPGMVYRMSAAQKAAFETFWTDDIGDGVASFDGPHPETGATVTLRITSGYRPVPRARGVFWDMQMDMEILP